MRTTGVCSTCQARVRLARAGDRALLLDPKPHPDGYVYVDSWGENDIPNVVVVGTPAEVPRSEPLRYRVHVCGQ